MAELVNPAQFDPYNDFRFRVKWDGRYVAGVSRVSALRRTTEVVEIHEGGDPSATRNSPGRTRFDPITLERGVTHDAAFEAWANQVWNPDQPSAPTNFRKDVEIELYNEAGQLALAYKVLRAWVSVYVALSDLDAQANGVAIQSITLAHEGWTRISVPTLQ